MGKSLTAYHAGKVLVLESVIENLPIGIALFEMSGKPLLYNKKFREIHGLSADTMGQAEDFSNMAEKGLLDEMKEQPEDFLNRLMTSLAAGRDFVDELEIGDRVIAIHDVALDENHILATHQDVTSRVTAERRVAHLAHHDALTDLPNRASFARELANTVSQAEATRSRFAVLSVDLDRFKDINDIFGHGIGDSLLCEVGQRLKQAAEKSFLARLGGDEFTLISHETAQPEGAAALAERLFSAVAGEVIIEGRVVMANLSIGVAVYPDDGREVATLLNNADAALYRAKADGRGVIRFYEPEMDHRIHDQRRLQQDMRVALSRNEFSLCYQPQATIDGEITGFEALVRWCHAKRGLIMPTEFIPLAEQTGQIIEIGEWILREACREAASWDRPLQIAVNLSPVQFRHGDLALLVHQILLDTGLPPSRLELEITESVLIDDFSRAIGILRRLKAMGVKIAMDDFGTGYSSLSYLQAFPFDKLKIDRSFVSDLENNHQAQEIVRAVIGLGRGLSLPIVAEGVETAHQLAFLAEEHCFGVQGYFVGRPEEILDYAAVTGAKPRPAAKKHAGG
jgi:diguanylate cyclase (GGDEF)-like protein